MEKVTESSDSSSSPLKFGGRSIHSGKQGNLGIFTSCAGPIGKEAHAARHVNVGFPRRALARVLRPKKV